MVPIAPVICVCLVAIIVLGSLFVFFQIVRALQPAAEEQIHEWSILG
jgi:hypothetical protein